MTDKLETAGRREALPASVVSAVPPTSTHRGLVIGLSLLIGLAIAVLWSAQLVDDDIGVNMANGILRQNAASANVTGTVTSLVFAFITGVAGTFTACNVAVFSAIAPMVGHRPSTAGRIGQALRPLGWLTLAALVVAGGYGAVGALVGSWLPQLSTATVGSNHIPVRLLQSVGVFGVIGLIMLYLGLGVLGIVPDPLARLAGRWPSARQVVMGVLIGGFLVGRPWPLFFKIFQHAASTQDALLGAATFALVVIGNMVLMGLLFLLLSVSRFPRWLRAKPGRTATVSAAALLIGGAFVVVYWGIRAPAQFGIGWFPRMPWH